MYKSLISIFITLSLTLHGVKADFTPVNTKLKDSQEFVTPLVKKKLGGGNIDFQEIPDIINPQVPETKNPIVIPRLPTRPIEEICKNNPGKFGCPNKKKEDK